MTSMWRIIQTRLREGPPVWLPAVSTLPVVAACVALGRVSSSADAGLAAGVLAAAILSPPLGLVALATSGLTSPLAFGTGTHTALSVVLLAAFVLGALWLIRAMWLRDFTVLRLSAVRAAGALALAAAVSCAVGNLPWFGFGRTAPLAAQLGGVVVFIASAAVLVLAADELRDPRWLQRVTWVFLALATAMVASYAVPELDPLSGWLIQPTATGSLTWTWFAALATAQAAFNRTLHWRWRVLLAVAVLGELAYGLGEARSWVSGWLPPLVAVVAVICVGAPRTGTALLAVGGAAAAVILPRLTAAVLAGGNRYSLDTRLDAWRIMARIVAANPLLGLGPANYYHVTPLFALRGYTVNFSSHSTYVDLLAQTGVIGLACFGWLAWTTARTGWQLRGRAPAGFAHAYVIGALGGLAGMLSAGALGDWLLPFVYNVTLDGLRASLIGWMFLGGLLALGRSVAREPQTAAPARWSTTRVLLAIVGVAVLLRVAAALMLGDTADALPGAADQVSYDMLAQRVAAGYGFSFPTYWYPFTEPNTPTAHWSYLYTLYLAALYTLIGHHPLVARLVQSVVSGLACWLVFRIGRRLFDERVGLAAAALSAVYAYFVFFGAALMTQAFFILALLASLDRALAVADDPRAARWAALGVSLGVGVLLRQTLLLYVPLLLAWLAWATRGRLRWRDAAGAVVLIALCIVPWTVRNYAAFDDFLLLNSNAGYFLYASNHPDQGSHFDPNFVAPLPADLRGLGEPAIDRALARAAFGFIAADPMRFLRLSWSRAGSYFWLLPSAESSPISNLARVCSFTLAAPLMLYGLLRSRRHWRRCMPLYLYLLVDTPLHLASWSAPRYRLPSDALLMVFAGLAVVEIGTRLGWLQAPSGAPGLETAHPTAARLHAAQWMEARPR
jgi:4-amino-4-deoxy-L-arabinose transferase-like glycosyltransferase